MRNQDVGAGETGLPEFQIIPFGKMFSKLLTEGGADPSDNFDNFLSDRFKVAHTVLSHAAYGLL
ncbi:MAG TPA: hypothetical protein DDY27_09215 [Hyphomonadaceae bacterium]|nr:hypothetical protein [Hyphomonadaceae bacterium]